MSVMMEQQGTSTSTVTNIHIPGVPSDASALNSIRNIFRRNGVQKRPTSVSKARTTEGRRTVDVPAHTAVNSAETGSKSPNTKKLALADAQSKPSTIERQANVQPAGSFATQVKANTQQSLLTPSGIVAPPVPDLITRNDRIRRILERVNWTKLRGDTVKEVATFQELEDAETKFQEFESFIRAEGKYLGLPEGCKPFERVLIQGSKAGSKPYPYIRFTNFRTEEDVQKYHAALSKRKVKHQYHPPLRLCYEIQRLTYHAASADVDVEGTSDNTLCGRTAVIEDGDAKRLVTIGGIIQVDNKLYAMTAGHTISAGGEPPSAPETESSSDTFVDSEYDDDVESALICGGPDTTSGTGWQPRRASENDRHQSTPEPPVMRFRGSNISGDDYSLHLIEDPLLALPNSFPGIDGATRYMTYPASQPVSGAVWLLAGVSGRRVALMVPGVVNLPLPSGNWVWAWKISLSHIPVPASLSNSSPGLRQGDSGSWVVDYTDGSVFGHVVASTDTSAFLIPLTHTLDSISQQAKLKGTGRFISLPPAFDMLANLARVQHNMSGQRNKGRARLFASRALMSSTLAQSSASQIAPVIELVLKQYQNYETSVGPLFQQLLMRTGADLKANLASMYHNGEIESLLNDNENSSFDKDAANEAILHLAVALGALPALSTQLFDSTHKPARKGEHHMAGQKNRHSMEQSDGQEPSRQSNVDQDMTGALPHSIHEVAKESDIISKVKPKEVSSIPGVLEAERFEKRGSLLGGAKSTANWADTNTTTALPFDFTPSAPRLTICGLRPIVLCVALLSLSFALIIAVAILGAFLGVQVKQNGSLQAQISKLIDDFPSCQTTTTITSTYLVTQSASTTAATSTATEATGSNGLSSGALAGIVVGAVMLAVISSAVCFLLWRRRRKYSSHFKSPSRREPNWDSPNFGGSKTLWLNPKETAELSASRPIVEIGPSHHIPPHDESLIRGSSSITLIERNPKRRTPAARVVDVLQLPDPVVGLYAED